MQKRATASHFWEDAGAAQATMRRLASLQAEKAIWDTLAHRVEDAVEFALLEDTSLQEELCTETGELEQELDRLEFQLLLSRRYDRADAILAIHAGAGGTDSQDWAEMMVRMYLRWAEARGYQTEVIDQLGGDEAGIKRSTVTVSGLYAYGYLRCERGVHRLVRLSPFDAAHRRHTSFALVETWPDIGNAVAVTIKPNDLHIDTFVASSAGGQHMQKNETAIRITHVPTGTVVSCQNERSQTQNRETALRVLRARLLQIEEEKRRAKIADLKGEHVEAGWGNQIRSYVMHPYQMVKDHRTNYETANVQAVIDGKLDGYMEAYLRSTMGAAEGGGGC